MRKSEPDEAPRLPIKLEPCSNGEFVPPPPPPRLAEIEQRAHATAAAAAHRLGVSRRDFLATTSGSAAVLLAINQLGCKGGGYQVPPEAVHEPAAADAALAG